jgi:hypothetical protein
MNQSNVFKLIGLILCLFPLSSLAIPIVDPSRFVDNGRITLDTVTGFEWLDVNLTEGISYYGLKEQFKPGGDFEGYRHATEREVQELFSGFNFGELSGTRPIDDNVLLFIDLFGNISTDARLAWVHGWVNGEGLSVSKLPMYNVSVSYESGLAHVSGDQTGQKRDIPTKGVGSFVVRADPNEVPEIDASSAPIALSLLLLTVLMRRERRVRRQ